MFVELPHDTPQTLALSTASFYVFASYSGHLPLFRVFLPGIEMALLTNHNSWFMMLMVSIGRLENALAALTGDNDREGASGWMGKAGTVNEITKQRNLEGYGLKIKKYRKGLNMTAEDLAQALQVTVSSVRNWECGISRPDPEYLYKMFSVLNVDPNEFFGIRGVGASLSEKEKSIVNLFRLMDDRGQNDYKAIGEAIVNQCRILKLREARNSIIRFPDHSIYAAAGSGGYWGDDCEVADVYLYNRGIASKADEVITVSGHSMEPVFHDQDRILIRHCTDVEIGQIYVFSIRNMGLVIKKAGESCLISLNPEYEDIVPLEDENVEVIGRVIGTIDPSMIPTHKEIELYQEAIETETIETL